MLLLAVWLAPGASALAVGLHLALDHHDHPGEAHERALSDLVQAATHGHRHPPAVAEHDHELWIGRAPATGPGPGPVAIVPSTTSPAHHLAERRGLDTSRWRGPPLPLFAAHCSLLL